MVMAKDMAKAAAEARTSAAMDLSLRSGRFFLSLKINSAPVALAVAAGAVTLGAFYLSNKRTTEDAVKRAVQRDTLGVVDPEVTHITDGHSILAELCCKTEWSFFTLWEDFQKNVVKFRLEEELKKIGFNSAVEVTICNKETIEEQVSQIRDRRISGKEAGNVDVKQGDLENFLKLKCGNYEEFAVQIYQKNVHAESRIEQEDVYKLCKKMHELQMHNKSLEEKLKGMEMEIKRLQAKEEDDFTPKARPGSSSGVSLDDLTPAAGSRSSSWTSLGQSWPTEDITIELFSHGPAKPQAGSRVEYQCKVRGSQQVFYQWFKDGQELQGENMSILTLDPLRMQDFGFYKCQVRIGSICVASKVVELNVAPARGKSYRKLAEAFARDFDLRQSVANLLVKDTGTCKNVYKHVASRYEMKDIHLLDQLHGHPGEDVLAYLESSNPDLNVYDFCKVLKGENIRRLDIVNKLVDYLI